MFTTKIDEDGNIEVSYVNGAVPLAITTVADCPHIFYVPAGEHDEIYCVMEGGEVFHLVPVNSQVIADTPDYGW